MLFYLFGPLHLIMISNSSFEMYEALTENMLRTSEINYVLNHLSESIIMLKRKHSQYSIEFVNDRFLYAFQAFIKLIPKPASMKARGCCARKPPEKKAVNPDEFLSENIL